MQNTVIGSRYQHHQYQHQQQHHLHLSRFTLHSSPFTLHPSSFTLCASPFTLHHPAPSTIRCHFGSSEVPLPPITVWGGFLIGLITLSLSLFTLHSSHYMSIKYATSRKHYCNKRVVVSLKFQ